jgi:hypothetical protein
MCPGMKQDLINKWLWHKMGEYSEESGVVSDFKRLYKFVYNEIEKEGMMDRIPIEGAYKTVRIWTEDGGISGRYAFNEIIKRNEIKVIYTISQYILKDKISSNEIELYRGITVGPKTYKKITEEKKITTNRYSSFSDERTDAEKFAPSDENTKGILFSTKVKTEDILMSYHDWISFGSWDESEFVIMNFNKKTYDINIVDTNKHKFSLEDKA